MVLIKSINWILSLIIVFFIQTLTSSAQKKKLPEATTLVAIIKIGDIKQLHNLVLSLQYIMLDSSMNDKQELFYFTKEPTLYGNTLACSTDKKLKITMLTFMTYNEETSNRLKSDFIKLNFKSSGKHKGGLTAITESEDFEKNHVLVATATRVKQDELPLYEFTILQDF